MKCDKVCRKLSSYIDNEAGLEEKQLISEHIGHCDKCAAELKLLTAEEEFLRQLHDVKPSSDFRVRFWERVRNEEAAAANRRTLRDIFIQRWIAVPIASSVAVVLFSAFTILSPLLYAMPDISRDKVAKVAAKTFTGISGKNVFEPLNLVEFCNNCHDMFCECCRNGTNEKCPIMKGKSGKCSMTKGEEGNV